MEKKISSSHGIANMQMLGMPSDIHQCESICFTTGRLKVGAPAESYQRLQKSYSLPSALALDRREWNGKVKYVETSPHCSL